MTVYPAVLEMVELELRSTVMADLINLGLALNAEWRQSQRCPEALDEVIPGLERTAGKCVAVETLGQRRCFR